MVHKILVPEADYSLLSGKQKFSCCNVLVIITIFFLGFTSIGFLVYNFFQTAIAEEKLVDNVKVPSWMHWLWNHNSSDTVIKSSIKPIDKHFIVCYYTKYKDESRLDKLVPMNIDPHLCTHIIIGFALIKNNTIDLGSDLTTYKQIVKLKKIVPDLKIMVSVGGADNDNGFPEMVSNDENRQKFIQSVLNVIKTLNLDGLDLDWEFPSWADLPGQQKIHFTQLIFELRKYFNKYNEKLILSAAVAAPQSIAEESYDISEFADYIDFINLMSYDYHFYVWYYPVTDLNAPVFSPSSESGFLNSLNVNFSANYWISKGMPKEKIIIGVPLYGHSYKLFNPLNNKIHAPSSGYGDTGKLGFVSYPEICQFLKNGAVKVFVNDSHVPYSYKNTEWISYDDVSSITYKANWIKSNAFKGAMVFSLNTDDWNSTCAPNNRFPLVNAVKKVFTTN